jgi:hypothetical protein
MAISPFKLFQRTDHLSADEKLTGKKGKIFFYTCSHKDNSFMLSSLGASQTAYSEKYRVLSAEQKDSTPMRQ